MPPNSDPVTAPSHYTQHAMECIEVLAVVLTPAEFRGYLLGNMLKYRWRRHDKNNREQDLAKADWYAKRWWVMTTEFPGTTTCDACLTVKEEKT